MTVVLRGADGTPDYSGAGTPSLAVPKSASSPVQAPYVSPTTTVYENGQPAYNYSAGVKTPLSATSGTGSTSGSIVSSSDQITTGEKATTAAVARLNSLNVPGGDDTTSATNASQAYLNALDNQIAQLEQRRSSDQNGVNADFDSQQKDLQATQTNETGTETATLARIGGYLGGSASGTGAMLNLAATHKNEILKLETSRQAAILAANNAIDDKEFDIAGEKAKEAKDLEATIYQRKQDFFDNSIKLQTQQESEIQNTLKDMSSIDPTKIPQATKDAIDSYYGVPGFSDQYFAVTSAAAQAKSDSDALKAKGDMLDLLQKIPAGQNLSFPDGTTYTGLGAAGDIATFMQTDANGVGHLITYNKRTGAVGGTSVGVVGKPSSTSGSSAGGVNGVSPTIVDNTTATIQSTLEANKDKDGKYDPQAYLQLRSELKDNTDYGPKLLKYYDNMFLNKANGFFSTDSINYLREKGLFYDAGSSAGTTAPPAEDTHDDSESDNAS